MSMWVLCGLKWQLVYRVGLSLKTEKCYGSHTGSQYGAISGNKYSNGHGVGRGEIVLVPSNFSNIGRILDPLRNQIGATQSP